jgi:hypothetical protein
MKPVLIFLAGLLTDAVWAASTISLQNKDYLTLYAVAFVSPYIQFSTAAGIIVDEKDPKRRFILMTYYAFGCLFGLAVALWYSPPHP